MQERLAALRLSSGGRRRSPRLASYQRGSSDVVAQNLMARFEDTDLEPGGTPPLASIKPQIVAGATQV